MSQITKKCLKQCPINHTVYAALKNKKRGCILLKMFTILTFDYNALIVGAVGQFYPQLKIVLIHRICTNKSKEEKTLSKFLKICTYGLQGGRSLGGQGPMICNVILA